VIVIPIIVAAVTYRICIEMQGGGHGIGKRKRAVVVHRSTEGEYSTLEADPRPDDERIEIDPEPVPGRIDVEPPVGGPVGSANGGPSATGVRQVTR